MSAQKSVLSLDKYWLATKRRWLPATIVFFPIFLLGIISLSLKKPSYVAEGKLRFQRINNTSSLTGMGAEIGKFEPVIQKSNPLSTEAEVISSLAIVQKTIDTLQLKDNEGQPLKPQDFIANLSIKDIRATDVLKVSYKDTQPQRAAEVVNTLMRIYVEQNISSHRAEAKSAREFLEQQIPKVEMALGKAELELRQFKEKNNVVALQEEASQAVNFLTDSQQKISAAKSKIADINAQMESVRKQLGMNSQQAIAVTSLSQSVGVQDILKEIQKLESEIASQRIVFKATHPKISESSEKLRSLRDILQQRIQLAGANTLLNPNSNLQIGQLKQQLAAKLVELESTRLGLASELSVLSNLDTSYRQRLKILPQLEQQQRELQRQLEVAQSTYSLLRQRLEESRIVENQNIGNVRPISLAEAPEEPISSASVSYLSAGLIALMASLAMMYLLEARDKSIKTVDEAKELLDLTLLGVITSTSKSKRSSRQIDELEAYNQQLVVRDAPRSPVSEAYRMLRANLKYTSADKELKVIVVTSSVPKEGKSTVSANLAIAMAQMERKVLLVDADLHCPVQHLIWETRNDAGLSNVIVGQSALRNAIKRVMPNLDILTAGVVPPNPSSLLDSKRMSVLLEGFAQHYDFIIIDAPSLNVAADAATLGQMADGVLLVARPGVVDSANASFAREFLEKSGQNVLGLVVNGVVAQNERHSYYYFTEESSSQDIARSEESIGTVNT